jgi:hypothetical protein
MASIQIRVLSVVQELGFELVYAATDSVFLKRNGASVKDFEDVKAASTFKLLFGSSCQITSRRSIGAPVGLLV